MAREQLVPSAIRSRRSHSDRHRPTQAVSCMEEEETYGMMLGSIHAVDDTPYDEEHDEPRYKGPQVRLGFHPPEKAYK